MINFPKHTLAEAPPFTYCAVNMFGPFMIKQHRNEINHYEAIFTSRAVSIQITHSLDSDSFIQALRGVTPHRRNINSPINSVQKHAPNME